MTTFFERLTAGITDFSDFICGYPMFLLLIGGGIDSFLLFQSRFHSLYWTLHESFDTFQQ